MTFDNSKGTRLARLCSSSICIVITVSFMLHAAYRRAYRDFAKRVTIALVLGNLLHAAVDLLGLAFHSKSLCVVYGMVRSWALLSTATWSVVLAVHIYSLLRYNRSIRTREKWLHLLCWLPSVVAALVPLSDSASYGEAGLWCWITGETRTTTAFEFVCFYVPMWSMLTVICVLYGRTMLTVYEVHNNVLGSVHGSAAPTSQQDLVTFAVRKLIGFPAIFVVTWIPGTVHRVYEIFAPVPDVLDRIHAIALALQGVLFVLYFHRRRILVALRCAKVSKGGRSRYTSTTVPQPSAFGKPRTQELSRVEELDGKSASSTFNPLTSAVNESRATHTYGQSSFADSVASLGVDSFPTAGADAASVSSEHALHPDASSNGVGQPSAV